eukprot:scaffold20900_cov64-Phaeocystis_antarctica.AAC.8
MKNNLIQPRVRLGARYQSKPVAHGHGQFEVNAGQGQSQYQTASRYWERSLQRVGGHCPGACPGTIGGHPYGGG